MLKRLHLIWASQVVLVVKNPCCQCRRHERQDSTPGSGRPPGGRHGNPLQYPCLETTMDRGAWWVVHGVTKSQTQLKQLSTCTHTHTHTHLISCAFGAQILNICHILLPRFALASSLTLNNGYF